jgi:hypothetical protein
MGSVKRLIPGSRRDLRVMIVLSRAVMHVPMAITRTLTKLGNAGVRIHDSVDINEYRPPRLAS